MKKTLIKLLSFVLSVIMILSFTACGKTDDTESNNENENKNQLLQLPHSSLQAFQVHQLHQGIRTMVFQEKRVYRVQQPYMLA